MEVEKLVKFFFVICLPLANCGSLEFSNVSFNPPLRAFVSGLIEDFNHKHPGTNQIVVLKIGNESQIWENAIKSIPKDNPLVVVDPNQCNLVEKRKAAFVIIVTDLYLAADLMKSLGGCVDEPFWISPSTNIMFLPSWPVKKTKVSNAYGFIEAVRRLNVVIVYDHDVTYTRRKTLVLGFNILFRKQYRLETTTDSDVIFPDKVSDSNRYQLKVLGTIQRPRLFNKNGKFYGYDVLFLEIAAKKLNAKVVIKFFNATNLEVFRQAMFNGFSDLCLNTMYKAGIVLTSEKFTKTFNTYDVDGFCALIPIPVRISFLKYLFEPYDVPSWILMVVSVVALGIVWKIFKAQSDSPNLNSAGHMVFLVIAGFLGQAFEFRHSRWFHLMIVQIFFFMVLILGNAYQSILLSLLMSSRNATRITTVDEMLEGGYSYASDGFFVARMEKDYPNSSLTLNLRQDKSLARIETYDFVSTAANNSVLVLRCDFANDVFYSNNYEFKDSHISDFYYILPEKFLTVYETLTTARFCPFIEKFAETALRIFESGIKQHWKTLLHKLADHVDLAEIEITREEFLLKMADLKYVFFILGFGLAIALIIFLIELTVERFRAIFQMIFLRLTWKNSNESHRTMRRNVVDVEPFEMIQF